MDFLHITCTISDYCDILRTHNAGDKLSVEVLRYSSQEVLEGQLDGRELEQTFSLAQTLEDKASDSSGQYDVWLNCGGTDTLLVVLAAAPADGSYHTLVMVQVVSDADLAAIDPIWAAFVVSD